MGLALKVVVVFFSCTLITTLKTPTTLSNEWIESTFAALCNCNNYKNLLQFPPFPCITSSWDFFQTINTFPCPPTNLHSSSTQQFNSITLFLSPLSLFYLPIPSTSPPIIKLSFKDNPSLSLFLSLIYNEPLWSIPTYTKIMLLMVPELVICHT